jgi:hypothetical protein
MPTPANPQEERHACALYLTMLAGASPGWIEVRRPKTAGRRQVFVPVDRLGELADALVEARSDCDVYVGVLPRVRRGGTRDDVDVGRVLWVDCDTAEAVRRLRTFRPWPSCVIASGGTEGGERKVHAYWQLKRPVIAADIERANRRLAHHLAADMASTDRARIMRPPTTLNFKTDPPRRVEVLRLEAEVHDALDLVGDLADPPVARPERATGRSVPARDANDPLRAIPSVEYVERLTGREVVRGFVACPFHADDTPSLHVGGPQPELWKCFGCGAGGSVIAFGARLFGIEPRGRGYHEVRRRLAAELLGAAA